MDPDMSRSWCCQWGPISSILCARYHEDEFILRQGREVFPDQTAEIMLSEKNCSGLSLMACLYSSDLSRRCCPHSCRPDVDMYPCQVPWVHPSQICQTVTDSFQTKHVKLNRKSLWTFLLLVSLCPHLFIYYYLFYSLYLFIFKPLLNLFMQFWPTFYFCPGLRVESLRSDLLFWGHPNRVSCSLAEV